MAAIDDLKSSLLEAFLINFGGSEGVDENQRQLTKNVTDAMALAMETYVDAVAGGTAGILDAIMVRPDSTMSITTGAPITFGQASVASQGYSLAWAGLEPTKIYVSKDGIYSVGGFIAIEATTSQRATAAARVYVNGSSIYGLRSTSYIRNADANGWDYWVLELGDVLLDLSAGDYIEIYIGGTLGATYGFTTNGTQTMQASGRTQIWVKHLIETSAPVV